MKLEFCVVRFCLSEFRAICAVIVTSIALCFSATSGALAQEASTTTFSDGKFVGKWLLTCEEGPCRAFFNLRRDDEIIIVWTMLKNPQTGDATSLIRVPTGVALQPGIRIFAEDDTFFDTPYQVCEPNGCTAILQMDERFMNAMTDRETARVAFYRYGEGSPEAYEIPIERLQEALDGI
jgi:invasion protein IalB